jgi:alanine racemase
MGSIGVKHNKAVEFVKSLMTMQNIIVDGIFTHCSSSDEKNPSYTNLQIQRFKEVLAGLEEIKLHIPLRHMANSGAIISHPEAYFNAVRPGLSLYGMYPSEEVSRDIRIRPVMSLKAKIIHIRDMEAGDVVGYGRTHLITKHARIATLPLGYDDGYNRLHSNQGKVIIRGIKAPIVGLVCMDQCFVDVSGIRDVSVGDEVVLYGNQGRETITAESVARQLNTIPYEITCNVAKRVPRIYLNGK